MQTSTLFVNLFFFHAHAWRETTLSITRPHQEAALSIEKERDRRIAEEVTTCRVMPTDQLTYSDTEKPPPRTAEYTAQRPPPFKGKYSGQSQILNPTAKI
jgi:hypothetical protein